MALHVDAAAQWQRVDVGTINELLDIYFFDANRGFIVGYNSTLLATIDGGQTWTNKAVPVPAHLGRIEFVDSDYGWISSSAGIFRTTDGGSTWTMANASLGGSISFVDRNKGWAASGSYLNSSGWIKHTTDGGVTWVSQASGLPMDILQLDFFDQNTGCAVGSWGKILWTNDGGQTWSESPSPIGSYIYGLQVMSTTMAFAAAEGGRIIRTTDAGTTWQVMKSGTGAHVLAISMSSAEKGDVVGSGGIIRCTTNGGSSWIDNALPSGVTSMYDCTQYCYFRDVFALNDRYSWAVGQGGGLFKHDFIYNTVSSRLDEYSNNVGSFISVDPNPTSGTATVTVAAEGALLIRLVDIRGRSVYEQRLPSADLLEPQMITLDLSFLSTDLYRLLLISDQGVTSTPLQIMR
ncbi:MAG: hypothetical protein IPH49_04080 [Ignavibacteria bacterium]|nr:hypothetical protein [Ignavibacteria bacterium]